MALFIVCGYLLSSPFAYAYIDESETASSMTAFNLAFGSIMGDTPLYRNTVFGVTYIVIPVIGFFFMFFDKRSNIKNYVGVVLGIVGCVIITMPIGFNPDLIPGGGAVFSAVLYMFITTLSAVSVLMKLEDNKKQRESDPSIAAKRLPRHS